MKMIIAIPALLLVLGYINSTLLILGPASLASIATPVQGQAVPIRQIPGLQSLTFWERSGEVPLPKTFSVTSPQLETRLNELHLTSRDFTGASTEFYDVFYSDADGTPNRDGAYVTVEAVWNQALPVGGGLNIAEVQLDFAPTRPVIFGSAITSFVGLGDNFVPASIPNAVDTNLQTHTTMGNTVGQSQRLRITIGFPQPEPPPGPGVVILDAEVGEGDSGTTDAVFRVGVNGSRDSAVSVDFTTVNFGAAAGSDYQSRTGTLTIPAGQQSANITVPIIGDTMPERNQAFFVRLSNARGATITDGEAVGVILDDDDPEAITVCSTDTPKDTDSGPSVVNVERDVIISDLQVRMFVENPFDSAKRVSASLVDNNRIYTNLFNGLLVPHQSSIGTTCQPTPDFVISDGGAMRPDESESPYVGQWRSTERVINRRYGRNAKGNWDLAVSTERRVKLNCWCLSVTGPREGLELEPARASVPVFKNLEDPSGDGDIGSHYVIAKIFANRDVFAGRDGQDPFVTFRVRDTGGNVILQDNVLIEFLIEVIPSLVMTRVELGYRNWVPGQHTIEAEIKGARVVYTDIARVTWTNPCAATTAVQGTADAETTLSAMRSFRDSKLAASKRGREYSRLYYKLSSEAVQQMLLNPMMILRSQEMIGRYTPVLRDMNEGRDVTLTQGDLDEIDGFLNYFASKGSTELKQTVKRLSEDLRNPEVHKELGITITPGPKRDLPARSPMLSLNQTTMLFGLLAGALFLIRWRRRKAVRAMLCFALIVSVVSGQWSVVGGQKAGVRGQGAGVSTGSGSDLVSLGTRPLPQAVRTSDSQRARLSNAFNKLPLRFEANHGQTNPQVKFISRGSSYNLFLKPNEAVMSLRRQKAKGKRQKWEPPQLTTDHRPPTTELRMKLIGGNSNPRVTGLDQLPGETNYLLGNDRSRWRAGVPSFAKVKYENVYDGVDMVYYGNQGQLEYDFKVAAGADPNSIRLSFDGADGIEIYPSGDLVVYTTGGEVRHRKPVVYQEISGVRHEIPARYILIQDRLVGFEVGEWDRRLPLVIDPVLEYSTYLGGSGDDQGTAISVDSEGNAYMAGITDSVDLPTMNASQPNFGGGTEDTFVAKLDPSGSRLLYLTYLGGGDLDTATGMAIDSAGNAYVTGFTRSTNFPTLDALQPNNRGRFNGFVTKLGPAGTLIYSTYLGGATSDSASGIAVDSAGNIYVAGIATSANFPVVNAVQANLNGASDLYVAKLNPSGDQLMYSTFLGGSQEDAATAVAVDSSGNVYVTGATLSADFRTANAIQSAHGGGIFDSFVVKLNPSGSLVYSTYLGGGGGDRGFRVAADSSGNAYVVGDTFSTNFPTANALQQRAGGIADAFVAKVNANGTLAYSTYLGGSGIDGGTAITVDPSGAVFVTGFTGSNDFSVVAALQPSFGGGGFDAFIAKLNPSGSALEYSTYLGGSGTDSGFGIAAGAADRAYVMGLTDSLDLPTVNPVQPGHGGGIADVFIAKIRPGPTITGAAIKGKHLNITGSGFERGAVILLDGEQQKTRFRSATSVKGKKVGQKIGPDQTVRLQVRNPDGLLSPEFSFTRTQ
jgi:hypothetical protein